MFHFIRHVFLSIFFSFFFFKTTTLARNSCVVAFSTVLYFLCSISLRSRMEDSTLDQTAHFVLYERTVTRERRTEEQRNRKKNNGTTFLILKKKEKDEKKCKKTYEKQKTPRKITINFWIKSIFSYVLSSLRSSFSLLYILFYVSFHFQASCSASMQHGPRERHRKFHFPSLPSMISLCFPLPFGRV